MPHRYQLILADDHPVVRAGMRSVLGDFDIVAEARDSTELFAALERSRIDVIVTDYAMPGGAYQDGSAMLGRLHRLYPHVKVIVFTLLKNPAILSAIAASPVNGIVNKEGEMQEIALAVIRVMNGMRYLGASVKSALENVDMHPGVEKIALSKREVEVIRLFLDGLSMTDIATRTNKSIKTISNQKQSALRKLGCNNDAALFQLKSMNGLGDMLQAEGS